MKRLQRIRRLLIALTLMVPSSLTWAQWELDNSKSSVSFVSIKNDSVGEIHKFPDLVGFIGSAGNVQVTVDLNSVDTLIPVRNERMREMLFETAKFPAAKITAQVDPVVLAAAAEGGIVTTDLPVTVSLHGFEKTLALAVVVVGEEGGRMRVFSARPVMLNTADFGLDGGVAALREIAGLKAISMAVPVTLQLVFVPAH